MRISVKKISRSKLDSEKISLYKDYQMNPKKKIDHLLVFLMIS